MLILQLANIGFRNQELSNFMVKKDYKNAIKLAIKLKHPFQLLNILYKVLENSFTKDSITGSVEIDEIFSKLPTEQVNLIKFI
jgi:U3 small nucleolar RNA-associated protein 13